MKWTSFYSAVIALLAMVGSADAGIFNRGGNCCGAEKSCGCAPTPQADCCRPVICRPTTRKVCTYQRNCCKQGCDTSGPACSTAPAACGPQGCAPAAAACAAPAACGPTGCAPAPAACAAPCGPKGCAPAPAACAAPVGPVNATCGTTEGCCEKPAKTICCDADPCEIAHWIYVSQTACHAKERCKAVSRIGNKFNCVCNPEIMCALVYALNDCDERVRCEAADEIGDQLRKNPCCCNEQIVAALTCALSDCDKGVRRKAERALRCCGYDVQDCCEESTCTSGGCTNGACGTAHAPTGPVEEPAVAPAPPEGGEAAPAPAPEAAPAPAPAPAEPEAYFPSRLKNQQSKVRKNGLSNLFGLRG